MNYIQLFVTYLRPYLEALSFLAAIVVCAVAIIGLRQIRLLKADIVLRNRRAAAEKAIECATRYLCEYCDESATIRYTKENKIPMTYEGPIGDFTLTSLPLSWLPIKTKRFHMPWRKPLNMLESIAAPFVHDVADSEIGFTSIGKSFCGTVQHNYDIIACVRHDQGPDYYENIVSLYKMWSPKLTAAQLEAARKGIEEKLAKLPDTAPKSRPSLSDLEKGISK